jgi:VanZ family protein
VTETPEHASTAGTLHAVSLLGPAVVYLVWIFVMGSVHFAPRPDEVNDKTAHFLVFGGLVVPVARATRQFCSLPPSLRLWLGALLASAFGALLEIWQAFLPHRSAEWLDWVADTAGAVVVALVLRGVLHLRGERRRAEEGHSRERG